MRLKHYRNLKYGKELLATALLVVLQSRMFNILSFAAGEYNVPSIYFHHKLTYC